MKKFSRRKIALTLAFASILSGKTQAKNEPKSHQTLAAVGGVASKNQNGGFVNWVKNHKWQLVAGTLTTATVVTLAALGIKYLIPKNKEETKEEELKEELKNGELNKEKTGEESEKEEPKKEKPKEELKNEELNKEKTREEPKKEEPKKEEPKKEDSQEVDAVNYILSEANKKMKNYISSNSSIISEENMEVHKSHAQKILKMIKSYFNKIKEGNCQCQQAVKGFVDYFNGTKKMQSKYIHLSCNTWHLLTILDFGERLCYIEVGSSNSNGLQLKIIVVDGNVRTRLEYRDNIPSDTMGDSTYLFEKDLLGE